MSIVRRVREFVGAHIIRAGVHVGGWSSGILPDEDPTIPEAPDPLHEDSDFVRTVAVITPEAAAMLSKPPVKSQVSPRQPLRGSLAARANEERRNR